MYRSLKTRMFYSKEAFQTMETPRPFAELRVFVISHRKMTFSEVFFDEILNKLEYIFISIRLAREKETIFFIEGKEENRWIDKDEARINLIRTGLPLLMQTLEQPYRQVHFFKKGKPETIYNEADIRNIEIMIRTDLWKGWRISLVREDVFAEDIRGLTMEELEAMMRGE